MNARMDTMLLVELFDREAALLEATLRGHPRIGRLFDRDPSRDASALRCAYLDLLKLKADYVVHTVPALRAAGRALANGDAEDRAWSRVFLGYAHGETDDDGGYGHHVWAFDDMRALGATEERITAPPTPHASLYGRYFVEEAERHPYAILGAKGVLEHFSLRVSDDIVRGVLESGVANAADAVSFFRHHGVLDVDHVREGDRNLDRLLDPSKRAHVVEGSYFTSGAYRSMVAHVSAS